MAQCISLHAMAFRQFITTSALILSVAQSLPAQDGGQLYEMVCGACHGADGNGAGEGTFPPLQGSRWIKGDPERMVQIILHGLEGPVEVAGVTYNLAMPPQGAALDDDQIVAIVNYVRSTWGGRDDDRKNLEPISLQTVVAARKNSANQESMWKAEELKERWPLPELKPLLKNLKVTTYKGNFREMPDFSKLEPDAVLDEPSGFVDLKTLGLDESFAAVWEGDFKVRSSRDHVFDIDSDDGSKLYINGELIAEVKGEGPMGRPRRGRALLKKGTATFRLEYFEASGDEGLAVALRGGGEYFPLSRQLPQPGPLYDEQMLVASEAPRVYRNFIRGTAPRSIGVGYPGGVNLSYNTDSLGISQAWLGDFIDAGRHWTGRGVGAQEPAGQRVLELGNEPSLAILRGGKESWPKSWQFELKPRFQGYRLDEKRRPEFRSSFASLQIEDRPEAVGSRELVRTLRLKVESELPKGLALMVSGPGAKQIDGNTFQLKNGVVLKFAKCGDATPELYAGRVIVRLTLPVGEQRIGIRYLWK